MHRGGQEFKSPRLHQTWARTKVYISASVSEDAGRYKNRQTLIIEERVTANGIWYMFIRVLDAGKTDFVCVNSCIRSCMQFASLER